MPVATMRRLYDELNVRSELEFVYKFEYHASFGSEGSEHELCHVFLGEAGDDVRPNDHEIAEIRYLSAYDLLAELEARPQQFTPWFKLEWLALLEQHRGVLTRYCSA